MVVVRGSKNFSDILLMKEFYNRVVDLPYYEYISLYQSGLPIGEREGDRERERDVRNVFSFMILTAGKSKIHRPC